MEGKHGRLGDAVLNKHAEGEKIKRKLYSKRHLEIPATHCGYLDSYRLQPNTIKIGDKHYVINNQLFEGISDIRGLFFKSHLLKIHLILLLKQNICNLKKFSSQWGLQSKKQVTYRWLIGYIVFPKIVFISRNFLYTCVLKFLTIAIRHNINLYVNLILLAH